MDATSVALKLLGLNKSKREAIIASSVDDYFKILYAVASDIYDSCIEDFYVKYTPTVYTRHGNLEGFNLYKANQISYENFYLNVFLDSDQLLPYGKIDDDHEDRREYVLSSVMKGIRGPKGSKIPGWPKHWRTSYPNHFSRNAGLWSSKKRTLDGILNDFIENAMTDMDYVFWQIVSSKI